jgi:hypothetical protein
MKSELQVASLNETKLEKRFDRYNLRNDTLVCGHMQGELLEVEQAVSHVLRACGAVPKEVYTDPHLQVRKEIHITSRRYSGVYLLTYLLMELSAS